MSIQPPSLLSVPEPPEFELGPPVPPKATLASKPLIPYDLSSPDYRSSGVCCPNPCVPTAHEMLTRISRVPDTGSRPKLQNRQPTTVDAPLVNSMFFAAGILQGQRLTYFGWRDWVGSILTTNTSWLSKYMATPNRFLGVSSL